MDYTPLKVIANVTLNIIIYVNGDFRVVQYINIQSYMVDLLSSKDRAMNNSDMKPIFIESIDIVQFGYRENK